MTVQSKFATLSMTCHEYVHPWTTSCTEAQAGLILHAIQDCLRLYVTVYTLALLMKGRIPRLIDIKRLILGVLQSSAFLTMSAFSYSFFACFLRNTIGHFNFLTISFIPSFLSSVCSILIERPSRRSLLCLYVANVATETAWRMAVARNYVSPIKYGAVLIFGISSAILMYYFRCGQHKDEDNKNDSMFDLLRFVVGPYEENNYAEMRSNQRADTFYRQVQNAPDHVVDPNSRYSRSHSITKKKTFLHALTQALKVYKRLIYQIKCGARKNVCPHPFSCLYYVMSGGVKQFSVGFGLQLCLKLLLNAKRIIKRPKHIKSVLCNKSILSLGLFLGGYSALFRLISCLLRWSTGRDSPLFALPAGLLASTTFTQYPDNTVALYVMWKMLQRTYSIAVKRGFVSELPGFTIFLYALSTATLFHAAIFEPTNLRPSYWKFLHTISGARIAVMSRDQLDIYGLNTTKSLEEVLKRTHTAAVINQIQF
ncbi:transmembrane protein 135-like [Chrysoperla carnea]|uniref:transmembrane protein 135-like n=1 Tax=Chrysoperla carnea TaxID=189513 RepID=UPI001D074EF1|nr:transmembrane protein 135-like [Chrysoperla carnea]XP_044737670.1 transmembrane protein 135-like [Chrysoperla carnea]XP_044737671.1 transmembrane protein 135-like [Chrysoperla carnea]